MNANALDTALDAEVTFRTRPFAVPGDLRPVWRLAVLVLILERCRGQRANLEQLHVMDWSMRNRESREGFLRFIEGKRSPGDVIVRYDPSLTRVIDFAFGERLVDRDTGDKADGSVTSFKIALTDKGRKLAEELLKRNDCLLEEKGFLKSLGRRITQSDVRGLFQGFH